MRLSVITITCRREARLAWMGRALAASVRRLPPGTLELEWVVVDEKLWGHDRTCDLRHRQAEVLAPGLCTPGLRTLHLPPKPSNWRGPLRITDRDLPDPNGARNTGLAFCTGDYVVFLDDNCLVTENWLGGLFEIARQGLGYRAFVHNDNPRWLTMPRDGAVTDVRESSPSRRMTPTQCNGLFGAPMKAFAKVQGFDESYAGEMKWEDLDAVVRLDRIGVAFYSPTHGTVIHLTHERGEVCDDGGLYEGNQNAIRWQAVLADGARHLPAWRQPTLAELRASLAAFPGDGGQGPDLDRGPVGDDACGAATVAPACPGSGAGPGRLRLLGVDGTPVGLINVLGEPWRA